MYTQKYITLLCFTITIQYAQMRYVHRRIKRRPQFVVLKDKLSLRIGFTQIILKKK